MRKVIISNCFNPYYNIAVETYLMEQAKPEDDILFLWQNDKTVVCGRNQNPLKECDMDTLKRDGGHVARRYSGGGTVYHDLGNLNFTFISAYDETRIKKNTDWIISVLSQFNIDAIFSGRNDILANGKKVSGGAFYEENGMLCHHGTLLVHSNIRDLEKYLQPSILKLKSKGIDSIRSRVLNLQEINEDITTLSLTEALISTFDPDESIHIAEEYLPPNLSPIAEKISHLADWKWIQGESPAFNVNFVERFTWGEVELKCFVENGIIIDAIVHTDALAIDVSKVIYETILTKCFDANELLEAFINTSYPWALEYGLWLSNRLPSDSLSRDQLDTQG